MAKGGRPKGRARTQGATEEPTQERVDVESLPDAADAPAVVAPEPAKPTIAPMPVSAEIEAGEEAVEAEITEMREQGEIVTYVWIKGGQPCDGKIQVSAGTPPQRDGHGNLIPGTGTDSVMIEFGKGSNPPGQFRTSEPKLIALIEATPKFKTQQIKRSGLGPAARELAALEAAEALGAIIPPELRATVEQRVKAATGGHAPVVQRGVRSTRVPNWPADHDHGDQRAFAGGDDLVNDPERKGIAHRALTKDRR